MLLCENGPLKQAVVSPSKSVPTNEITWNSSLATVAGDILENRMVKVRSRLGQDAKDRM